MQTFLSPRGCAVAAALAFAGATAAVAAPRLAPASSGPAILVWDNDNGVTLCDPDLSVTACVEVGTEVALVRSIIDNGGVPVVVPELPTDLTPYDAVYITLGWATPNCSAGHVTSDEQARLIAYNAAGHAVFLEGNDVAETYQNTPFLEMFGAIFNYTGTIGGGNVSQLIGRSGSFAQGMVFSYPFGSAADSGVDDVLPGGPHPGQVLFDDQAGPGKAMSSPSEGGAPRRRPRAGGDPRPATVAGPGPTVLFTASFSAMPDGLPPSTKDLLMGRVLLHFGLAATAEQPSTWGAIKALFHR